MTCGVTHAWCIDDFQQFRKLRKRSTLEEDHSACHITGRATIRDHTTHTEQHMRIGILVFKRAFEPCPVSPMSSEAFDYILSWLQKDQIDILTGSFGLQAHLMRTLAHEAGAIGEKPFSQWLLCDTGEIEGGERLTHPSYFILFGDWGSRVSNLAAPPVPDVFQLGDDIIKEMIS